MYKFFKRFVFFKWLKSYFGQQLLNQKHILSHLQKNFEQLFLNYPVLIVDKVQIFIPLFYVDHIQKTIFRSGQFYEHETLTYLKNQYVNFRNVIDVGSNIGNHFLFFCSEMGSKNVHCFEPNAYNRTTLLKNIQLNHLGSVVSVYPVALGHSKGVGIENGFALTNTGMNQIMEIDRQVPSGSIIDIETLDKYSFKGIDFLKIDVEGFEINVLKGAANTLRTNKMVVLIEVFTQNQQQVDLLMKEYGYKKTKVIEEFNCIYEPI